VAQPVTRGRAYAIVAAAAILPRLGVLLHERDSILTAFVEKSDTLAQVFLKKTTVWGDGESIRPVDLPAESSARRHFSDDVLERTVQAVKSYWQQRIFSGRGVPPPELETDEGVVAYVTKHRGGVGYVSPSAEVAKAKVLRLE